jgi:hypothetical protein
MPNILINPESGFLEFNTGSASGSAFDTSLSGAARLKFQNSGELNLTSLGTGVVDKFTIDGSNGRLLTVNNTVTGSIFSVNDVAGLPIVEVFSDDRVVMGQYASDALVVSGSGVSFANLPTISGNPVSTGAGGGGGGSVGTLQQVTDLGATTTNLVSLNDGVSVTDSVHPVTINRTDGSPALIHLKTQGGARGYLGASSTDAFNVWNSSPTRLLTVLTGGNVGIGSATPGQKLDISAGNIELDSAYAIQWGGGNNRIWGSDGNDYIKIETSGLERLRVINNGDVGIGTIPTGFSSASRRLVVGDGQDHQGITIFGSSSTSSNIYFADGAEGSATYQGFLNYRHDSSQLKFGAAGGTRMTLNGNGLLIFPNGGTPSTPNAELEISSSAATIRLTDSDLTNHYSEIEKAGVYTYLSSRANAADGGFIFFGGATDTEFMRIDTAGKVGIGTDAPTTKLHIHDGHLRLNDTYKIEWGGTNVRIDGSNSTDSLRFFTSDTTRMTIDNNGKVGIGQSQPSDELQVQGQVRIDGSTTDGLTITSNSGVSQGLLLFNNSSTDTASIINYYNGPLVLGQNNTGVITIDNGYVGIGTNDPDKQLHVKGTAIRFEEAGGSTRHFDIIPATAGNNHKFTSDSTSAGYEFYNNANSLLNLTNTEATFNTSGENIDFRVKSSGSTAIFVDASIGTVGINQSSPSSTYALDVGGSIRMATTAPSLVLRETDSSNQEFSVFGLGGDFYVRDITQSTYPFKIEAGVANDTLVLESGGNVGIGTNNPNRKVVIDAGGGYPLKLNSTQEYLLALARNGTEQWWFKVNTVGDFTIHENTVDDHFRIKAGGNVGIGTANPITKLVVDTPMKRGQTNPSGLIVTSSTAGAMALEMGVDSSISASYIESRHTGSNTAYTLLLNAGYGKVGVGTVSPTSKFEVGAVAYGTNSIAKFWDGTDGVEITNRGSSRQQIDFLGSNTSAINAKGSLFINYDSDNGGSNDNITFTRNGVDEAGTVDMIIKEGSVGIGTNAPSGTLHVENGASSQAFSTQADELVVESSSHGGISILTPNASRGHLYFNNDAFLRWVGSDDKLSINTSASSTTIAIAESAGNTTIGGDLLIGSPTDTHDRLMTQGAANLYAARFNGSTNGSESYGVRIRAGSTSVDHGFLVENTAGADLFMIKGDGNVFISGGDVFGTGNGDRLTTNGTPYLLSGDVAGGGSVGTLQQVTDLGATTTGSITASDFFIKDGSTQIGQLSKDISSSNFVIKSSVSDADLEFKGVDGGANITAMLIDMSEGGRVGIGSNTPARKLDVVGDAAVSTNLIVGTALYTNQWIASSSATQYIKNSSAATSVAITNAGNVGIGTDSPAQKLHVEFTNTDTAFSNGAGGDWGSEGLLIENLSSTTDTMAIIQLRNGDADFHIAGIRQGTNDNDLGFFAEGSEKVRFTNAGYVGIGSNSPQTLLDVDGAVNHGIRIGTNNALIGEGGGTTGTQLIFWNGTSAYYGRNIAPFTHTVSNHFFRVGGNDKMAITSAGVGIGTASPFGQLDIFGTENAETDASLATSYHLHLHNIGDDTSESIGIGFGITSAADRVGAAIAHERKGSSSYGDLYFSTRPVGGSVTERMRITATGNVGIGTNDPTAQYDRTLHIEGGNPTVRLETNASAGWAYNQYVSPETTWSVGINDQDQFVIANAAVLNSNLRLVIDDSNGNIDVAGNVTANKFVTDGTAASTFGIINADSGIFASGITINGNPVVTGTLITESDGIASNDNDNTIPTSAAVKAYVDAGGGGGGSVGTLQQVTTLGSTTSVNMEIQGAGSKSFTVDSTDGHASVIIDRHSTSYDANLSFQTNGATKWRLWNDSNDSTFSIRDEVNASNVMTWEVGGNIGIGTDDPDAYLDITTATNQKHLHVQGAFDGGNAPLAYIKTIANGNALLVESASTSDSREIFEVRNGSGPVFDILGNGNVGIAVADPDEKLEIDGNIKIGADKWYRMGGNAFQIGVDGGSVGMHFHAGSSERLTILAGGNVGIGTATPATALHVSGQASISGTGTTATSADLFVHGSGNGDVINAVRDRNDASIKVTSTTAGAYFRTNSAVSTFNGLDLNSNWFIGQYGTNDLRIVDGTASAGDAAAAITVQNTTKYVGIGTTNPTQRLHVKAEQDGDYVARITNTEATAGANYGLKVDGGSNSSDVAFEVSSLAGSSYLHVRGDGNVGIGTNAPSYNLDVIGTTRSTFYIGGAYLEENASSSKLKFYKDGTVLVMDEDGELKPCDKENDTLVFGVSKKDFDSPVVLGAEPVLVTGPIEVGDYIVTSNKQGHGQAMKENKFGTVVAQAMEKGDGESYNIKAMIRKM